MSRRELLLCAASGILVALSVPLVGAWPLAWFAWVPLLAALRGKPAGSAFRLGFTAGLVANIGTFHWIVVVVHTYGHAPLPFALLVLLLLASYLALYPALWAAGVARSARAGDSAAVVLGAALWVGLELLRAYTISGFPWAFSGNSQASFLPLIQVAEWTGAYGVSFLLALANLALAAVLWRVAAGASRGGALGRAAAVAVLIGLVIGWGGWRRAEIAGRMAAATPLRVAIVQANIPQDVKWNPEFVVTSLARHLAYTRDAAEDHPDLVVWPEAAVTFFFQDEDELADLIFNEADGANAAIFFGASAHDRREGPGGEEVSYFNSAYLVGPGKRLVGRYDKIHLVPFGEYVPFRNWLRFVSRVATGIAGDDFKPGAGPVVFDVAGHRFGPLICYESIFPELSRSLVGKGADFLVNVTNDAWFGRSGAPGQHLQMAVFRAVENRVGIARAANTGISAVIQPTGEVAGATALFTMSSFTAPLWTRVGDTFYTRHGDVFAWLCAVFGLGAFVAPGRRAAPARK